MHAMSPLECFVHAGMRSNIFPDSHPSILVQRRTSLHISGILIVDGITDDRLLITLLMHFGAHLSANHCK